jgi:SAM-dependent methyltransferase
LSIFDEDERARFLDARGRPLCPTQLPWELLCRLEPELYARLIVGEHLHPRILDWLPPRVEFALEVGAGNGRLTLALAPRCGRMVAVEPAEGMRRLLVEQVHAAGHRHVEVVRGFFDAPPVDEGSCDLVITCSAVVPSALAHPERCLAELERRCAPGGLLAVVWPADVGWWQSHGYEYVSFDGPMSVEFSSVDEAVELARIFYPRATAAIASSGNRMVDYETLGLNPPRDLCWKRRGLARRGTWR